MKITKFGHSCFLIEEKGVRVLFDPGSYSSSQDNAKNLDTVVITHSHSDHLDRNSLDTIMKANLAAIIVTNTEISNLLKDSTYNIKIVEEGNSIDIKGLKLEALGNKHYDIYPGVETPQNTGYFVGERLFNPGDNLTAPGRNVEILTFPMIAPWLNVSQMFDYVKSVKPQIAIPLHDGILKNPRMLDGPISEILTKAGIKYMPLELDKEYNL